MNVSIIILLSFCINVCNSYFIYIEAHSEECFYDKVSSGTKMNLMFEVTEGGSLDIDVKVVFF